MREAYDVNMGQYAHANEPIHHMIYMYNYAGTPSKAQDKVRKVLQTQYNSGAVTGGGYVGDEDNGQMSAWYVFSALGFYPARMGSLDYTIGAPLFPSATRRLTCWRCWMRRPRAGEVRRRLTGPPTGSSTT